MDNRENITLTFLGGAGTVTGSKYLVEAGGERVLVDCGLFQGLKEARLLNWASLPIDPGSIRAVILTHAHLDHTGYLPLLVKEGFRGGVYATPPTQDLAELILRDSAAIQEEEAELANQQGYSKHHPALPLYTVKDAEEAFQYWVIHNDEEWIRPVEGMRFRFRRNGHILGSCLIEMEWRERTIVFSGDLGRQHSQFFPAPTPVEKADYLLLESTYGDRLHPDVLPEKLLAEILHETSARGGTVIIPSFAVGRAQEVLLMLAHLREAGKIPPLPVYLDSPMGADATRSMQNHPDWHKLSHHDITAMCDGVEVVHKFKDSLRVAKSTESKIIIAGSGMVTGGRVLHYLEQYLDDKRAAILLTGYQAEGTRGRQLKDGAHEVKIHGTYYPVKAQVHDIPSLSAHADQNELLQWAGQIQQPPRTTFLVHGEPQAADVFRVKLQDSLHWNVEVAVRGKSVTLV